MQQRSILIFEQSIKSPTTRLNYKSNLERFLKFAKIRDYDALLSMSEDDLQELVENYVIDLKGNVNPNSIPCMMSGVKHFFEMNRKRLYWKIIQKIYPEKIKRAGYNSWSTEQVRKMLEYNTSKRNKAIIHFIASTGARVGVFDYDLSMKRLRDMEDGCKAVLIYAGEPDEYWTFLTPEAASALEEYFEKRRKDGEIFNPDTPIFTHAYPRQRKRGLPIKRGSVISIIVRTVQRAGIERKRVNRNFDIQIDHGFRKRFNTILKLENEVNSNIAEKIMGHSVSIPLDNTYFTPTLDRIFAEFKKAIQELTIDPTIRQKALIAKQKEEISELQKERLKSEQLEDRIKRLEQIYEQR